MNRRNFCLASLATAISGAAVAAGCVPAGERAAPPVDASAAGVRLYKFIYDRRYPAARSFGAAAQRAPCSGGVVAITGDITELWSRDLEPLWRSGGGAIAGLTSARTLLCLEQLARNHWMRVVIRAEHAVLAGQKFAHRLTAPEPMIARLTRALAAGDWAPNLPASLATCSDADGARVTLTIGPTCRLATMEDTLVSFVIA
jgi:hypothetical protein